MAAGRFHAAGDRPQAARPVPGAAHQAGELRDVLVLIGRAVLTGPGFPRVRGNLHDRGLVGGGDHPAAGEQHGPPRGRQGQEVVHELCWLSGRIAGVVVVRLAVWVNAGMPRCTAVARRAANSSIWVGLAVAAARLTLSPSTLHAIGPGDWHATANMLRPAGDRVPHVLADRGVLPITAGDGGLEVRPAATLLSGGRVGTR